MEGSGSFTLKIISENGDRRSVKQSFAVLSFHGGFPLQKPRMLVRLIRTCFVRKQGGCGNYNNPSLFRGGFCRIATNADLSRKPGTARRPPDLWINLCECNEHRESEALEMAFVDKACGFEKKCRFSRLQNTRERMKEHE